jgi:diketogulonate reductase-like aldo/keto reductase
MEELYKEGKARAIGVCNFNIHHIEELMQKATIVPAINQFEVTPLFTQEQLIRYCKNMGIQPMAYTPLGRMHDVLIKAKPLREISAKYSRSVPQVILRWDIQNGLAVVPRTSKPKRVDEFLEIFNFSLTDEEMKEIRDLNDNIRLRYNPDKCDFMAL